MAHGARQVGQLCKHWAHKLEVDQSGNEGVVCFPAGAATMEATPRGLAVTIQADGQLALERLRDVVAATLSLCLSRGALPFA